MDLRLVVGGLLTRNAVLSTLLVNYADRLEKGWSGHGASTSPCFIVPSWSSVGKDPTAPCRRAVLTIAAHAPRGDPRQDENLDSILQLLHGVLTDDHARGSITARRLVASADQASSTHDTVVQIGLWEIAPVPSRAPGRPGHGCWRGLTAVPVLDAGGLVPGTASLN